MGTPHALPTEDRRDVPFSVVRAGVDVVAWARDRKGLRAKGTHLRPVRQGNVAAMGSL